MSSMILKRTTRLFTPVILLVSLFLLARGHDAPGGGFVAALVGGAAVVLRYLSDGAEGVHRLVPVGFSRLLTTGLLSAVGTGAAGYALDGHFLAGTLWRAQLPLIGDVKVPSSMGFDLGVYLVVLSTIVAIVEHLGEERA